MEMLFTRDFTGFSGGHLKFLDYLRHTAASGLAAPTLYQTPGSAQIPGNPFNSCGVPQITTLRPFPSYFLAGMDWYLLDDRRHRPRRRAHGQSHPGPAPRRTRYAAFRLPRAPARAAFASASRSRMPSPPSQCPVHAIPNGIELPPLPVRPLDAPPRIFINGSKNPEMATEVAARLHGQAEVDLATTMLLREDFLARMAAASICVLLPLPAEGFFLPRWRPWRSAAPSWCRTASATAASACPTKPA